MVAIVYRRWLFTRGSNCEALTGKILEFWLDRQSLMGGGCTQRFSCIKKQFHLNLEFNI